MPRRRRGYYEPEDLGGEQDRRDAAVAGRRFCVYVLETDRGHYVGHSARVRACVRARARACVRARARACVRARARAPADGRSASTAGTNPELAWTSWPLETRAEAARFEAAMKALRDRRAERFREITGLAPEPPEYPDVVIREAVLNALAHRDYGLTGATTDITIRDDRLEIRSPGPLPGHITVENMRAEHYSRNRRLMGVLQKLGLVEEFGEGMDRMFSEMDARLMTPPDITATSGSVTVTLYNRILGSIDDQAWMALLADFPMTRDERLALVETRRRGTMTRRRLRELLPESDPGELLASAVAKGLLVRTGRGGGTHYVLSPEVVLRAGSEGMEAQRRRRQALLNEIERRGSLSTVEGARLLGEDRTAIRALLNELAAAGLVRATGNTRARRYHAPSASRAAERGGAP